MIHIEYLPMSYYDAIIIRFDGDDGLSHNIIIDGGDYKSRNLCYTQRLKPRLNDIFNKGEVIDLWIISHIDDDHIGGLLNFVDDMDFFHRHTDKLKYVWMNYAGDGDYLVHRTGEISVNSGISLRDFLIRNNINIIPDITAGFKVNISGAGITVLAPDHNALSRLKEYWCKEEFKIVTSTSDGSIATKNKDYNIPFKDFEINSYDEDNDVKNNSSIAIVLSYNTQKFLFAADSCSSLILEGLMAQGFISEKIGRFELMHVPHHGSCRNSSKDFFDHIDCTTYIITGNGQNRYQLPNKETIARLLASKPNGFDLHFSTETCALKTMFENEDTKQINIHYKADLKYE
jgi:beta-lactamase superfamily II metal-dependent hydrolase